MSASSTEAPPTAATYAYGVVAADSIPTLERNGVADAPVRAVKSGELAALVSALPEQQFRIRRRDLLSHLSVLEDAFGAGTVIPCAFGMVLASDDAVVREFLDPRREELLGLLSRLDGYGQLNVRVSYDEQVVLEEIVRADPTIAQLREETRSRGEDAYDLKMRLGELVAAALAYAREQDGRMILERLVAQAADVAVDNPGDDVLKASFLVAREGSIAFDRELEDIAREQAPRLRIDVVGPLPPSAFATLERGAWES